MLVIGGWLIALSVYDLRHRRLPNALTLPGAVLILVAAMPAGRGMPAVLGALALGLVYLVVHLIDPAALGAGDVKLAIGLGALTGAFGVEVWLLGAFGAVLLTALAGIVVVVLRGGSAVPHGPSMCAASAASVALAWW
ncbi:MAG: A24 family peptidase [Mycolicibacterium frederiksbergense]|nr:A24 family peptidase [Mycolicibacterium frederiksbergense]MBX9921965.1 A24 family peptidase [Mycolicibacterium frederiksbergense]MDO0977003.1 A24 family peptidase [Mycolicibacterium frederiksbergense]